MFAKSIRVRRRCRLTRGKSLGPVRARAPPPRAVSSRFDSGRALQSAPGSRRSIVPTAIVLQHCRMRIGIVDRLEARRAWSHRPSGTRCPSAPCPTAGIITSNVRTWVMCAASPSRLSPASASTIASNSPCLQLADARVDIAADVRQSADLDARTATGPVAAGCRCPHVQPPANHSTSHCSSTTSTSAGLSRGGTAASITRPPGRSANP